MAGKKPFRPDLSGAARAKLGDAPATLARSDRSRGGVVEGRNSLFTNKVRVAAGING